MPEIFQLTLNLTTADGSVLAPSDIAQVLQNAALLLLQNGYQDGVLVYQSYGMAGNYKFRPSQPQGTLS